MRAKDLIFLILLTSLLTTSIPFAGTSTGSPAVFFSYYENNHWSSVSRIAYVDNLNATRDTHNRKVFYAYNEAVPWWFAAFWNQSTKQIKYSGSTDGTTWDNPTVLDGFSVAPYWAASHDFAYQDLTKTSALSSNSKLFEVCDFYIGSNGAFTYWFAYNLTESRTLSNSGLSGASLASSESVGGSVTITPENRTFFVFNRDDWGITVAFWATIVKSDGTYGATPDYSTTTGGNQIVPLNTSSPYSCMIFSKNSTNNLRSYLYNRTAPVSLTKIQDLAILKAGFSTYCAASEAQYEGDPEIVHLVYIKSTGQLAYRKYQSGMGAEEILDSNAEYPVINVDSSGKVLVSYIKAGAIYYLTKTAGGSWSSKSVLSSSSFANPVYLSSNHNAQDGKIGMIWTANSVIPDPTNTRVWIGISLPYVYAAVTLWSLAMTIGIAACLAKGLDLKDLPILILIGMGILICLFISLAILSGFLRL